MMSGAHQALSKSTAAAAVVYGSCCGLPPAAVDSDDEGTVTDSSATAAVAAAAAASATRLTAAGSAAKVVTSSLSPPPSSSGSRCPSTATVSLPPSSPSASRRAAAATAAARRAASTASCACAAAAQSALQKRSACGCGAPHAGHADAVGGGSGVHPPARGAVTRSGARNSAGTSARGSPAAAVEVRGCGAAAPVEVPAPTAAGRSSDEPAVNNQLRVLQVGWPCLRTGSEPRARGAQYYLTARSSKRTIVLLPIGAPSRLEAPSSTFNHP